MEGGTHMQPDLEHSKPILNSQGQFEDEHKVLSAENGHSLQIAKPADKNKAFFRTEPLESQEGMLHVQDLQFDQPGRRKPSPALWRLALMIGDSILLIVLLVRIIDPAPHLLVSE